MTIDVCHGVDFSSASLAGSRGISPHLICRQCDYHGVAFNVARESVVNKEARGGKKNEFKS